MQPQGASCYTCEHFDSEIQGDIILCRNPILNPVHAQAERGCAFWMRAIGSDDEPHPSANNL